MTSSSPGDPVTCSFSGPCLLLLDHVPKSPSQESRSELPAGGPPSSAPRLPRKCDQCSQSSEPLPGPSQSWTPETEFPDDLLGHSRCLPKHRMAPASRTSPEHEFPWEKSRETLLHVFEACGFACGGCWPTSAGLAGARPPGRPCASALCSAEVCGTVQLLSSDKTR